MPALVRKSKSLLFPMLPAIATAACFWVPSPAQNSHEAPLKYTLTIYVDEKTITGHVFVKLTAGTNVEYYGFYPPEVTKLGRDVRNDVARPHQIESPTYEISKDGYLRAVRAAEKARNQGLWWCPIHHCGDFAQSVANAAGVPIHLPEIPVAGTSPAVFGQYLLQHGGIRTEPVQNLGSSPAESSLGTSSSESQPAPSNNGLFNTAPDHPRIVSPDTDGNKATATFALDAVRDVGSDPFKSAPDHPNIIDPNSAASSSEKTDVGGVFLGGKPKFEDDEDVDVWFDQAEKKADKKEKPAPKGTGQTQAPPKSKKKLNYGQ